MLTSRKSLGIIGLGLLGSALAERLIGGGLEVSGYDVDAGCRDRFAELGGRPLPSAAAVAESSRRLLLVLPDDRISRDVLNSIRPMLSRGAIVLDATTGDPLAMAELGRHLADQGIEYLDATISGSSVQARRGEALLMVGGTRTAFDGCQDLFSFMANRTIHTGPCGSGAAMKLVTNLVLGLNRAALAEGLVLASRLGLDREQALVVLQASAAYSRAMDVKGEKMIQGDFTPQARLSQHLKDVRLMLDAAARSGQSLPLTETHRHLLEQGEASGLGEMDNSAILSVIEQAVATSPERNRQR